MKSSFPYALLFSCLSILHADQWSPLPSGTTHNLYSIAFHSQDTAFVSGAAGTVLRSWNGGNSWTILATGTAQPLYAIDFPTESGNTVLVAGGAGTILKSTNGGSTWASLSSGTSQALRFIAAKDDLALAGGDGGVLLRTTNGGTTWTLIPSGTTASLRSFGGIQDSTGNFQVIVVGDNVVLRSADLGEHWTVTPSPPPALMYSVVTGHNQFLAAGAAGSLYRTTDLGATWTAQNLGVNASLNAIGFPDSGSVLRNPGYIVGGGGLVLKTTDLGASWTPLPSGTTQSLNAVVISREFGPAEFFAHAVGDGGVILRNDIHAVSILRERPATRAAVPGNAGNAILFKTTGEELLGFDPRGRQILRRLLNP